MEIVSGTQQTQVLLFGAFWIFFQIVLIHGWLVGWFRFCAQRYGGLPVYPVIISDFYTSEGNCHDKIKKHMMKM